MKRRQFITNTGIAGAAAGSMLAACNTKTKVTQPMKQDIANDDDDFELNEITVSELQQKFAAGSYTAMQVTQWYLDRIAAIDQAGPELRSVLEINPDALNIAAAMDAERKSGKVRGPLHGVPVLIKDNIDTSDKMQTTAGSLAMAGHHAKEDAFIVNKLREAGAVLLGKTNLSEWANFRSPHSSSGWSSRGGQTKNPYILDRNPCGSSAGSGVAVAANLCTVAIGTETDGSVTCPAAVNGIVGLKPTVGLLSRSGIIPISATQDTPGPMARTVIDVAILLSALTGVDDADVKSLESRNKFSSDYSQWLKADALKGKRLGIEKNPQGDNQYLHALVKKVRTKLEQAGATIIEISYMVAIDKLGNAEFELMQFEFKDGLNKYLAATDAPVKSLAEVIAFNKKNEDKAMPYFRQETLESSDAKADLHSNDYIKALKKSHEGGKKIIDDVMENNNLDAICGLTMGPACSIDLLYGDRWGDVFLTQPAAITGYPHITVPAGLVYDLPVGFSFFGKPYTEGLLLGLAYAYEQANKNRKKPMFRKSFL